MKEGSGDSLCNLLLPAESIGSTVTAAGMTATSRVTSVVRYNNESHGRYRMSRNKGGVIGRGLRSVIFDISSGVE